MKIDFYELNSISDENLKYGVIGTTYEGKLVFVKHKERDTWEIPGGRREPGESIEDTGRRELIEETGAEDFFIKPICEYSITIDDIRSFGRLFYSEVFKFGELPDLEIGEVSTFNIIPSNQTYPDIQPVILKEILRRISK